jgi:hypothetical protein
VNRKNLLPYEKLAEILSPEEFSQVVFVHKALFCGAARTHDLAVKICMLSEGAPDPCSAECSNSSSDYNDGFEIFDDREELTNISFPYELVAGFAFPLVLFTGYKVYQYFNSSS